MFRTHLSWLFCTYNNNLWMATICNNGWLMKYECGFHESGGAEGTNYLDCDSVCELKGLSPVTLLVCHWCAQQVWSHRHLSPLISDAVAWSIHKPYYRAVDLSEYLLLFSILVLWYLDARVEILFWIIQIWESLTLWSGVCIGTKNVHKSARCHLHNL